MSAIASGMILPRGRRKRDRAAIDEALGMCATAAGDVPSFELRFKPDASAVEAVEDVLRREV